MMKGNTNSYAIYLRKSSDENHKQEQSLVTQKRICEEWAVSNNLNIYNIFEEKASAMDDGNRPVFDEVISLVKNGVINAILVAHMDRLARNFIEAGELIKLLEQGLLKEIRTPNKVFSNKGDSIYMYFDFVFATYYSRQLSVKVKEGIQTKLQKGEYPSNAPTGYVNKDKKIYPDPQKAPFIKRCYELYATGDYSQKDLVKILYKEGFRTEAGNKVRKSVIGRILNDPIYWGKIRRKGVIYDGVHKPIVSVKLANQVQKILEEKNNPKKANHKFLYRGFMFCEECGCKLTATKKTKNNKDYVYYYCTNGKGGCTQHRKYLNEQSIEDLFIELMKDFQLDREKAEISLNIYKNEVLKEIDYQKKSKELLQKQLTKVEEKLDKLLDLYLNGNLDERKYKEKQNNLKREESTIKETINSKNTQKVETTLEILDKIKDYCCDAEKLYSDGNSLVKENMLKSLLWKTTVENGKIASIQYKTPYDILAELSPSDDIALWRRRWDSNPRADCSTLSFRD